MRNLRLFRLPLLMVLFIVCNGPAEPAQTVVPPVVSLCLAHHVYGGDGAEAPSQLQSEQSMLRSLARGAPILGYQLVPCKKAQIRISVVQQGRRRWTSLSVEARNGKRVGRWHVDVPFETERYEGSVTHRVDPKYDLSTGIAAVMPIVDPDYPRRIDSAIARGAQSAFPFGATH